MNLEKVLSKQFPSLEHTLVARDCMLYSLGIGFGLRPEAPQDLQFLFEEGLKVAPAMVNVIGHPGAWVKEPELGINWVKILHGEQSFVIHRLPEPGETFVATYRVTDVVDKGVGAMLYLEKVLKEKTSGQTVSTVTSTYVLRGDGGCGSTRDTAPAVHNIPERSPDFSVSLPTLPQAGLIYRLSGDYNPIHASPDIARKAGFERPILHGLCTMGVATRAIMQECCSDNPDRLKSVKLRFSSPVYPGDTIRTEFWQEDTGVSFRAIAAERDAVVLNNGFAEVHPA